MKSVYGFLLAIALPTVVSADNAALTTGGQPRMMDHHPSVAMESEGVHLVVHWNRVETDCSFVFVNHGKACNVNMGFPDFGLWAYAEGSPKTPRSLFLKYASFVDGKPVRTKLVLGKEAGEQWQTKTVSFAANGKRTVREVYTTQLGGVAGPQVWGVVAYLLHTGASWRGNIGKATITVTFAPDSELATPIDMVYNNIQHTNPKTVENQLKKRGGILASGPSKPTVNGRTLTFVKQNWRPSERDDIYIAFAYPKRSLQRKTKD